MFFDPRVDANQLRRIADVLLEAVPRAVECVEERILGPLAVGDLEIRFTPRGSDDVGGLAIVVEIRSKRFQSRVDNAQDRAELIRAELSKLAIGPVGVWLTLLDGAWSQSD